MTDDETFARVFGRSDWAMMFILACEGQSYGRLRFNVGPSADVEIPTSVDYAHPFGGREPDAWEQEYLENIQPHESVRGTSPVLEPVIVSPICRARMLRPRCQNCIP